MRIVIIGPAHPYRGGIASYNERLAKQFTSEGHEASIHTFKLQYPSFLFPGKTQYSEEEKPSGIEIFRSINSINPLNWWKVGRALCKQKPDLIIVRFWIPFMGPSFGTILRVIKRNTNARILGLIDNIIPHESRFGDKVLTRYFIKPLDGFISMSNAVANDIKKFDSGKPVILSPHPLFDNFGELMPRNKARKLLKLDPDYHYILFFGLVRAYKGLDLLIEAFSNIKIKDLKVKLIIAGEYYDNKSKYDAQISEHNLNENVIQVNRFIREEEVRDYFNAADLVVQPYKSATQSGVTQIAYHFNKPMIVTDVGGLPEQCPNDKVGYVVPVDSVALANAIVQFFKEDKYASFEANIKTIKKEFSWDVLTNNIISLSNRIVR